MLEPVPATAGSVAISLYAALLLIERSICQPVSDGALSLQFTRIALVLSTVSVGRGGSGGAGGVFGVVMDNVLENAE